MVDKMDLVVLKSTLLVSWLLSSSLFGLFLFTKGFFLTRIELNNHTTLTKSSPFQGASISETDSGVNGDTEYNDSETDPVYDVPWVTFDKAILLIIDGLRFDFVEGSPSNKSGNFFYENNMLFVNSLMDKYKTKTRLFRFIADPPTTTMQRLKGLTTGSLPTFIDASANFASSAIMEDNLLFQMRASNKKIVLMGDDTWVDLYPNYFERQFPYPSFDVKDLDTVDNGIISHLIPEIKKSDWDVIIAHFLGVDHCGHRYGPNHPEMRRKLMQMDFVIKDVANNLDNDTLLLVFGDHGMTQDGDHGGDSENEVTAALIFHSRKSIFPIKGFSRQFTPAVSQISIVPTLALQLNIPIPFSNIGSIIEDFFLADRISKDSIKGREDRKDLTANMNILLALFENSKQVYHYLLQYSIVSSDISGATIEKLKRKYNISKRKFIDLYRRCLKELLAIKNQNLSLDLKKDILSNILDCQEDLRCFIQGVYHTCLEVWAKFDPLLMLIGKLILLFSASVSYLLQNSMWSSQTRENALLNRISRWELVGFSSSILSWLILAIFHSKAFYGTVLCAIFQIISLTCLASCNHSHLKKSWSSQSYSISSLQYIVIFVYACGLFSNSFIVHENSMLLFLIQTLLFLRLLSQGDEYLGPGISDENKHGIGMSKFQKSSIRRTFRLRYSILVLVLCVCLRISVLFWSCREEQQNCEMTSFVKSFDSLLYQNDAIRLRQFTSITSNLAVIFSLYIWCKNHGNMISTSPISVSAKLIMPACGLSIILHWVLQVPVKNKVADVIDTSWVQQTLLPRFTYFLLLFSLSLILWNPISSAVFFRERRQTRGHTENQISFNIQVLFKDIRSSFNSDGELGKQSIFDEQLTPHIFGLHRVYSTAYFSIMTLFSLFTMMLLGDGLASSILLMNIVILCFLFTEMYSSENIKEMIQCNAVIWSFLASFWFFSTGHQCTIPSIRFDAGFIGLQGDTSVHIIRGSFFLIVALLIVLNTFSSHVYFALAIPLLHIWCTTSQIGNEIDASKRNDYQGELMLQKDSLSSSELLVKLLLHYIALRIFKLTILASVAFLHRRHLMVWRIFGPRFLFEAASFAISAPFLLLGCLSYFLISNAVHKWISKLTILCNGQT